MNGTDRPRERISVEYMIMEFQENMSRKSSLEIEVFGLSDVRSLGFWTGVLGDYLVWWCCCGYESDGDTVLV